MYNMKFSRRDFLMFEQVLRPENFSRDEAAHEKSHAYVVYMKLNFI